MRAILFRDRIIFFFDEAIVPLLPKHAEKHDRQIQIAADSKSFHNVNAFLAGALNVEFAQPFCNRANRVVADDAID